MVDEEIRAKKCTHCGTINHPSKIRCLHCRTSQFEEISHPPRGTIVTFTNCYALPERLSFRKSQGFAIIRLQPGWNILGQLENPDDVSIGTRVVGRWSEVSWQANHFTQKQDKVHEQGWIFQKEEK